MLRTALICGASLLFASSAVAETCTASIYSTRTGTKTASGVRLVNGAMTAAHKSLPFHSRVRVSHAGTGRSIMVRITDRGPFIRGRCIDLTPGAAGALGCHGLCRVHVSR